LRPRGNRVQTHEGKPVVPDLNYLLSPKELVSRQMREEKKRQKSAVFWFTGLSGSGKSTIAHGVEHELFQQGFDAVVFDGDAIRHGLCGDLGFSAQDRLENIRRIAEVSRLFARNNIICLCAFISPLAEHRKMARQIIGDDYHEIYVSCSLEECERRDVKGFYQLAREGKIKNYTGVSAPYDAPTNPQLRIETDRQNVADSVRSVTEFVRTIIKI
jgi:adenylylsulfate kinase